MDGLPILGILAQAMKKRRDGVSLGALAKRYGVSRAAIQRIERRTPAKEAE